MYRIITDTSANLELELLERKGIAEIPFSFSIPEKGGEALYCPDFSAFDSKAFYDAMRSGTRVTTSQGRNGGGCSAARRISRTEH